jgi:UDP-2,4-diacetamido-2,4,6-trideoxy-beta-L-altropyranose hydrolase
MRVAFRTEGNHKQGMGDVWGSIAMAEALNAAATEILFIVSEEKEGAEVIRRHGYRCESAGSADIPGLLRSSAPDVVVFNKLRNSVEEVSVARQNSALTLTIDDDSDASRSADLNINPLYPIPGAVCGPGYVPLRDEFQDAWTQERSHGSSAERILISMGGSDTYGFTPDVVKAVARVRPELRMGVVLGPAFSHQSEFDAATDDIGSDINVIRDASNMAELMLDADMAITAGGLTMFEACCVGTPLIVVCGERFEVATADEMASGGAAVNLGFGGDLAPERLTETVASLAADQDRRREMGERARQMVDGRGATRIAELIRERHNQGRMVS